MDGGFAMAGETRSFPPGTKNGWVVKIDSSGQITWQKAYGGGVGGSLRGITERSNGTLLVQGTIGKWGAGLSDLWVMSINSDGTVPPLDADTTATSTNTTIMTTTTSQVIVNSAAVTADSTAVVTGTAAITYQQAP